MSAITVHSPIQPSFMASCRQLAACNTTLLGPVDQLTLSSSDSTAWGQDSLKKLVGGATGAVAGAAILGVGATLSSIRHIPKGLGDVVQSMTDHKIESFDDAFLTALSPVMAVPLLMAPFTGAILGVVMGGVHGAYEGSEHGLVSAVTATANDVRIYDKVADEFSYRPWGQE